MAFSGIDPMTVLTAEDPVDIMVIAALMDKVQELEGERRQDLANRIAQAVMGEG